MNEGDFRIVRVTAPENRTGGQGRALKLIGRIDGHFLVSARNKDLGFDVFVRLVHVLCLGHAAPFAPVASNLFHFPPLTAAMQPYAPSVL